MAHGLPVLSTSEEDIVMFADQRFREPQATETECANHLAHVESKFCWCDPIVEIDESGQKVVVHIEVTWH
jgi:hypothetical protein